VRQQRTKDVEDLLGNSRRSGSGTFSSNPSSTGSLPSNSAQLRLMASKRLLGVAVLPAGERRLAQAQISVSSVYPDRTSDVEDARTRERTFSRFIAAGEIGTVSRLSVRAPVVVLIFGHRCPEWCYASGERGCDERWPFGRTVPGCLWCCCAHGELDCP
jgi:hypothetical protein